MSQDTTNTGDQLIKLDAGAKAAILELRKSEPEGDRLALWLEVSGVADDSYTYDMYFQLLGDAGADDTVVFDGELALVIPESSVPKLAGASLEMDAETNGMVLVNPNTPPRRPGPPPQGDLTSELAQRVLAVLETQINPGIAAHGGRADLVAVDDGTAYLRLGGGCQGCGMAPVTLSQGIEVAIKDAVPEIVAVVDVTDHAGGTNPYYQPSKK
jgi:Fe/S biogenesis protein NfuA